MGDYADTSETYGNETEISYETEYDHFNAYTITRTVYTFLFILVGLPANITVVALVLAKERLRTITNMYLLNRSLVDILILSFYPYSLYLLISGSDYEPPGCYVWTPIYVFCTFSSWMFLVFLPVDWYMMSRPQHNTLQYRWKVLKVGAGLTWVSAVPLAVLLFLTPFRDCPSLLHARHPLLLILFTYLLTVAPVIVLWIFVSFTYPPKSSTPPNTDTSEPGESLQSLRRFILTLAIVNTACRMPYRIFTVLNLFLYYSFEWEVTYALLYVTELVYIVDPILYLLMRTDLKETLMSYLKPHASDSLSLNAL